MAAQCAALAATMALVLGCTRVGFEQASDAGPPPDAPVGERASEDATRPADFGVEADLAAGADARSDPAAPFSQVAPLAALNTAGDEDDPTLTGDMLEIFFERDLSVWRSVRATVAAAWSEPVRAVELSSADNDSNPEITPDGLTITVSIDHLSGSGSYDIYLASRPSRDADWSALAPITELNTNYHDAGAILTRGLLSVVFVSRRNPVGVFNLFVATRPTTSAPWEGAAALSSINTAGYENSPWLDPTGTVLYFVSDRGGNEDIWVSTRAQAADAFGPPVLVQGVNTPEEEDDPWLSPDMRTLYFARRVSATDRDIYTAHR